MKLIVQHVHVASTDSLDRFVEERIISLEPEVEIEEAKVRLECLWQESPPFRVRIHLVTPGPDLVAEDRDHTLQAAAEKALAEIEFKIRHRHGKRTARLRSNPERPAHDRFLRNRAATANSH